jgi:TatD DNase family protein
VTGLFDAHCHLQDLRLQDRLPEVLFRAGHAGVKRVVCCGTAERDWPAVQALSRKYPELITPAYGLHPWYVRERSPDWLTVLESFLRDKKAGVGEIGLDFALAESDRNEQSDVFTAQIELARRCKRPVSIHCRKAWDRLLEVLEPAGRFEHGGLVHSYSGTPELIPRLITLGLSFSFSGSVTRTGNRRGVRALQAVPLEHLLAETDSPDMPPAGVDGLSEPAHLRSVLKSMSLHLNRTEDDLARITAENAARIFGLAGKDSPDGPV